MHVYFKRHKLDKTQTSTVGTLTFFSTFGNNVKKAGSKMM